MNPKSIERALDRYRAFKDEDVRRRLAIFGPLILEAAAISNELDDEDVVVPCPGQSLAYFWRVLA